IQLFQGLNVELAQRNIREEIERTEKGLLSCTVEEADARIREMVALYPHPDVYRRAMRFFNLRRRPDESSDLALRLLDLLPEDPEANLQVARFLLHGDIHLFEGEIHISQPGFARAPRTLLQHVDGHRLISIAQHAYAAGQLRANEKVKLAGLLEDM